MGHYAACRLETLIASELFCRLEGRHGRLIQIFSKVISICYAPAVTHDPLCAERFQSSLQCWFHGCFVRVRGGYSYSRRWALDCRPKTHLKVLHLFRRVSRHSSLLQNMR